MTDPTREPCMTIENHILNQNQIQSQVQSQEKNSHEKFGRTRGDEQNHFGNNLRNFIRSDCIDIFLKVFHAILCFFINHKFYIFTIMLQSSHLLTNGILKKNCAPLRPIVRKVNSAIHRIWYFSNRQKIFEKLKETSALKY